MAHTADTHDTPLAQAVADAAFVSACLDGASQTTNYHYHGAEYCFTDEAWPTIVLADGAVLDYVPVDDGVLVQYTDSASGECSEALLSELEHSGICLLEEVGAPYTLA